MRDPQYPTVVAVDVIPARPNPAALRKILFNESKDNVSLEKVTFIVKIGLESMMPATSQGVELYLDNYWVMKYWGYQDGIYFKVYNPRFFRKHGGKQIRFAIAGEQFYDTGWQLPKVAAAATPAALTSDGATDALPSQEDVFK